MMNKFKGHLKKTSTVIELLDVGTFEKTESERAAKVFEEMSQRKSNVSSVLPPLSQVFISFLFYRFA